MQTHGARDQKWSNREVRGCEGQRGREQQREGGRGSETQTLIDVVLFDIGAFAARKLKHSPAARAVGFSDPCVSGGSCWLFDPCISGESC